jgi:hypothetical protein
MNRPCITNGNFCIISGRPVNKGSGEFQYLVQNEGHKIRPCPRIDGRPDPSPATAALQEARCNTVFQDGGLSGATTKRPALLRCLEENSNPGTRSLCGSRPKCLVQTETIFSCLERPTFLSFSGHPHYLVRSFATVKTWPRSEGNVIWQTDKPTQTAARSYPLPIYSHAPVQQDQGGNFEPARWLSRLRSTDGFPPAASKASPDLIIAEFRVAHYLPALALIVCWGGMARTIPYIYRQHSLQKIHDALEQCAQSISRTDSIHESWDLLTQGLQWTNVITSKTLHFLCRALGFNQDPPVPIDRGVILEYVWPGFRIGIPPEHRPLDWEGNTFAAYCRYMTAIVTWGQMKQPPWTTTEVESTIYAENE